jgi:hypothetical protein
MVSENNMIRIVDEGEMLEPQSSEVITNTTGVIWSCEMNSAKCDRAWIVSPRERR